MKILLVHSDFIEYEPRKKAISSAEEIEKKHYRVDDCLVVFCSSEEGDAESIVPSAVAEIKDVAKQVEAKRIVLYPFVHLTIKPSKPQTALKLLKEIEKELKKDKSYEVYRAPFGWYKSFTLKCKGHPLSELSREITAGKIIKERKEEKPLKTVVQKIHVEREKLSANDHRILGQQLDLYSFQEVSPGMVFFHPKGMLVRNLLVDFWRREHQKRGYLEINTPLILKRALWEISGHWDHFKENMLFTEIDEEDFAVKPMNCPGAILVFKSATRSYRDLPMRLAELGHVHRKELSGVLAGLFRLRYFTQDDAHIFVTEEQLEGEIENVVDIVNYFYTDVFGFDYHVELSTRPENKMGSDAVWDKAEHALESALKKKGMNYKINPGDGAFYGPKIDFHIKDSQGRTWQCATVQVDFMMPERFDAAYIGEDNKPHRPVMVHRVVYGAVERFLGILVEHYAGAFPLWLAPVQVKVISLTDRNAEFAKSVKQELEQRGLRVELDVRPHTVEYKVREAQISKVPYIIVVGDKEEQSNALAVRTLDGKVRFGVPADEFAAQLLDEIERKAKS